MRELKFRAWLVPDGSDVKPSERGKPYFDYFDLWSEYGDDTWFSGAIVECFEQYTGLKDKNGKEIYDGDIVKCYFYGRMIGIYQVIWNEDIAGFEMEAIKGNPENDNIKDIRSFAEMHLFMRVIGNIHENKELLEEK